jgi:putative RNA 2'-phosphotransferase
VDPKKSAKQLAKFFEYALGRRPDEFGLVLDSEGYVKIKTFLKAISEESGWKHIRRSWIDALFVQLSDPPIEVNGNLIRAIQRSHIPSAQTEVDIPKTLYICVRKKGYRAVLEKGILPYDQNRLVLTSNPEMAIRLGKRIDPEPVLLTVLVQKAKNMGSRFYLYGESLYLADAVPIQCFTGPLLAKEKEQPAKREGIREPGYGRTAGSYFPDLSEKPRSPVHYEKKVKDKVVWKKDQKRIRREKEKLWER